MYVITAAVAAVLIGTFLFLKFDPFKVSAHDNTDNNMWSQQIVKIAPNKQYKILHVMSYHSPWEWTDNQLNGFQAALKGLNVRYNVMQMDAKRRVTKHGNRKSPAKYAKLSIHPSRTLFLPAMMLPRSMSQNIMSIRESRLFSALSMKSRKNTVLTVRKM